MYKYIFLLLILINTSQAQVLTIYPEDCSKLYERINQVCPISGISLGKYLDKSTWRIDFKPEATDKQKQDARAIIDGWTDLDWEGTPPQRKMKVLDKLVDLHTRILALEREKSQVSANVTRVNRIQTVIDDIQTQIETLRSGAY